MLVIAVVAVVQDARLANMSAKARGFVGKEGSWKAARRAKLPPGMQLENLREFAKRHQAPANPDQPQEGGQGSGIAQTFSAQALLRRYPTCHCRPTLL